MDIKITTTIDSKNAEIIRQGSIIVDKSSDLSFEISDLKFVFHFEESKEKENLIKAETIKNQEGEPEFMRINVKVDPNELNSIFLPPAPIATIDDNGIQRTLYLSFNVRSLTGDRNNCILFLFTYFKV